MEQWSVTAGGRCPQAFEVMMTIDEVIVMGAQVDPELLKTEASAHHKGH